MIKIKSLPEIKRMRDVCALAAKTLDYISPFVKEGITTLELNDLCEHFTHKHGAISAPLNYKGYPKSICVSVNNVVCHGIPSKEIILEEGDIVNVDVTPLLNGYHGDSSRTYTIGQVSENASLLVERVKKALQIGIDTIKPGGHFGDIGTAISEYVSPFGYGVVKALGGHGIGKKFHEPPFVYHFHQRGRTPKFRPGQIFTVEPMINEGHWDVVTDPSDGWTVYTKDGSLSAQFEHTVLVTQNGAEILTLS